MSANQGMVCLFTGRAFGFIIAMPLLTSQAHWALTKAAHLHIDYKLF